MYQVDTCVVHLQYRSFFLLSLLLPILRDSSSKQPREKQQKLSIVKDILINQLTLNQDKVVSEELRCWLCEMLECRALKSYKTE